MFFSHFSLSDLFGFFNILENMMALAGKWPDKMKKKKNECCILAADESWKMEKIENR